MPSESRVEVHTAREDELDAASRVIKAAYREYGAVMPASAFRKYIRDIGNVRSRLGEADLLVATIEGKVAGAVTLYLDGSRSAEGWPKGWAGIRMLAVHPRYRGRGAGLALMQECLRRCREQGIKTVGLHTTEAMAVGRRMYERMGFLRAPQYDFHPRPDMTVMAYKLDL
ncbi:MAG: GNAT family N-acetyltransferase [Dehalococcoidia bacterium]|nr:GNAT family N-acetyltransferase [Dehalococcoidia bacterium]